MSKFTKTLVAAAVAGLFAGSAQAEGLTGLYQTAPGKPATAKLSGQKCKNDKSETGAQMTFLSGGSDGPNSGIWTSLLFDFGLEGTGAGEFIAAKQGKTLTMDMLLDSYFNLDDELEEYAFSSDAACKNIDSWNDLSTVITRFDTKISKNGDKVKVRMNAEGTYADGDKDRKVKVKLKAKMDKVPD